MNINIEIILADLKDGKEPRTQKNLQKLNEILSLYSATGNNNFSITQIGRYSKENGGPAYEALRATRNRHYRSLIEAWAQKSKGKVPIPNPENTYKHALPADNILLQRITDPAVRALFGQIIAERNRYRKEVNLLKQHANIVIDRRTFSPSTEVDSSQANEIKELTESEINALNYAISEECMYNNDWVSTKAGQVKTIENNIEIFPRGFTTALSKLLYKEG
ncbi:gamma-mobile-trio protein GmtX [Pseudoalteromonas rhizosphaerae]|uniref:gamma-mobile-trio protein GmtX n=1 Tax=Pseudoalteromonas rhizosphaerae TaxID=2518973 RepID=UPI002147CF16|nr:gamma-mobile-trio protein GmtX [Pseudoalteromonas rhizosphaerae]